MAGCELIAYFLFFSLWIHCILHTKAQQACVSNMQVTHGPDPTTSIQVSWTWGSLSTDCEKPADEINSIDYFLEVRDQCEKIDNPLRVLLQVDSNHEILAITGLVPFSKYRIHITLRIYLGTDTTHVLYINTSGGVPGIPENVKNTNSTATSLEFSWDDVQCGNRQANITSYGVSLVRVEDRLETTETTSPGEFHYKFEGLVPNTEYEFSVQARAYSGGLSVTNGPYSESIRAVTLAGNNKENLESSDSMPNTVTWLSISFAVIVLLAIVSAIVWFKIKRKFCFTVEIGNVEPTRFDVLPPNEYQTRDSLRNPSYWEISWDNLQILDMELGKGKFGNVQEGAVEIGNCLIKVAVKTLPDNAPSVDANEFEKELNTMKTIGRHINIVSLVGICKHEGMLYVALEYMSHGNLLELLRNSRIPLKGHSGPASNLTSVQQLCFALDVAKGMKHLADHGIIHRDLGARNVLIGNGYDGELIAKVSDFGLSRGDSIYMHTPQSETRIPVKWTAIEAFTKLKYTTQSDVWSFGILLWEIATLGAKPYPNIGNAEMAHYLSSGNRMDKPNNCDDKWYDIMMKCWRANPQQRPTFDILAHELAQLLDDERNDEIYVLRGISDKDNVTFVRIDSDID